MTADEVMACVRQAVEYGYGTVVLQAGEDPGITSEWMADLVRRIKTETQRAVTLSLGERDEDELAAWRHAGADRYLLRFETSNHALYDRIHPPRPGTRSDRIALLGTLRRLGYEVGSGVMIGIPGQTYEDLARDIELFRALDLDMIGVGPYLVHPDTPLGAENGAREQEGREEKGTVPICRNGPEGEEKGTVPICRNGPEGAWHKRGLSPFPPEQVPNSELMTYKVIALARLVCQRANIPSTTALATLNAESGRELGLVRGANVIMPNLTPARYRVHYEIYPNKACLHETAAVCHRCTEARIRGLGRTTGGGRGDSPNFAARTRT
jgi:biotin synthase